MSTLDLQILAGLIYVGLVGYILWLQKRIRILHFGTFHTMQLLKLIGDGEAVIRKNEQGQYEVKSV